MNSKSSVSVHHESKYRDRSLMGLLSMVTLQCRQDTGIDGPMNDRVLRNVSLRARYSVIGYALSPT